VGLATAGFGSEPYVKRLLVPSAALLWGLQIAFLIPTLALILVTLYDASTAEVGWVLTVYNASGFVASLLVPSYADRREDYLRPMLACRVLTLVPALVLAFTTTAGRRRCPGRGGRSRWRGQHVAVRPPSTLRRHTS
jgi:MFS family permease